MTIEITQEANLMTVLYYDCFSGISGDMNLGALIDLGADEAYLRDELSKLKVGGYELAVAKCESKGISGTKVDVVVQDNVTHRNLNDIRQILHSSEISSFAKDLSDEIFSKIARAEAQIHGKSIDEIHFHEVGATDAIVDIVGACLCLENLNVDIIQSSAVELGSGVVRCAHGLLPVPAPATLALLTGKPSTTGRQPFEATTPTGAAILATVADQFVGRMDMNVKRIGYGIGTREAELPNVLRVILGDSRQTARDTEHNAAVVLECNLDDMNPEMYEHVMDALFDIGASDVFLTNIIMKKSRPAVKLGVLCSSDRVDDLADYILKETPTLGIRKTNVEKTMLKRSFSNLRTKFGDVRIKHAHYLGRLIKSKPEYEDCKKLAVKWGVSIKDIYSSVDSAQRDGPVARSE